MDIQKLTEAAHRPTPEQLAGNAAYGKGHVDAQDGKAAMPQSSAPHERLYNSGYQRGWVVRESEAGRAVMLMGVDTFCPACKTYDYGQRLGCRCGGAVEYHVMVQRSAELEHLSYDQARDVMMGDLPVFDSSGHRLTVTMTDNGLQWDLAEVRDAK